MLQSLHVKNLALIDEVEVEFHKGLNILTGETGAGKSIIVGSINLALGEKVSKDMVRDESVPAFVELIFHVDTREQEEALKALDIFPEDECIILSRKITSGRSVARVNSETVTVSALKAVASIFIDIYGQHEHQTLLHKKKHLELLDSYAHASLDDLKKEVKELYGTYRKLKSKMEDMGMDESERIKELDLLEFEISEISSAYLKSGEDEELEQRYRKMTGSKKVAEAFYSAYRMLSEEDESASSVISRATRELSSVSDFDETSQEIYNTVAQVEDMLNQLGRDLSGYLEQLNFSQEEFYEVEQRLNEINRLKDKYGYTIEDILLALEEKQQRVDELNHYEEYKKSVEEEFSRVKKELLKKSEELTGIRKKMASELTFKVTQALIDLNFLDVAFDMHFEELKEPTENGMDAPEFKISVNPGEALKPLDKVASGGELSRIMLAMKSVLATNDKIPTLIFDEIDTGISGRTAQMVAEKMNDIGRSTQIISITHLPQIAAMADAHFLIEKQVVKENTVSNIHCLTEEESYEELARMLGGAVITDAVLSNAKEMKELAKNQKK
ncbi:MAG: DNA repair protein RecN [Lachnospiraceae bacterium]|nr:DNA repair protein RecN [Lachnospiraceae bacterium]